MSWWEKLQNINWYATNRSLSTSFSPETNKLYLSFVPSRYTRINLAIRYTPIVTVPWLKRCLQLKLKGILFKPLGSKFSKSWRGWGFTPWFIDAHSSNNRVSSPLYRIITLLLEDKHYLAGITNLAASSLICASYLLFGLLNHQAHREIIL